MSTQANLSNLIVACVLRLKLSHRRQSLKNNEVKFPINKMSRDEIEKENSNKKRSKKKQIAIQRIKTKFDIKIK